MHSSDGSRSPSRFGPLAVASSLLVAILLVSEGISGAATTTSVLTAAKASIAKQTGVHVVISARSDLTTKTESIVGDIGSTSGSETVVLGQAKMTIQVTPTMGYVKGNSSAFTTVFGLSASQAGKIGSKWAYWKAGTSQYTSLKGDVTLSAVEQLFPKAAGTKLSTAKSKGATIDILKWTTAATSSEPAVHNTLTFSTGSNTLPLTAISTATGNTKITTTLTNWGESINVNPPPSGSTIAG